MVAVTPVLPRHAYPQATLTAMISPLLTGVEADVEADGAADDGGPGAGRAAVLARLHASSGVATRHLAMPIEAYATLRTFGETNGHFIRHGLDLTEQAVRTALDTAGLGPADVDLILFTSVTGVSAPSLDALLVRRLGMRPDVRRMPSFGLGCAGGAAGVARVHDYLVGHPNDVALLVSVELCSLTLQHGDDSTANLVSSGLFGDGAAAVVMVGDERHEPQRPDRPREPGDPGVVGRPVRAPGRPTAWATAPRVVATRSHLYPDTEDQLAFNVSETGFRIVLSAQVPSEIRAHLEDDVVALLEPHDLKVRDVTAWVVHAGGPRILDAVQETLDLDPEALALSRDSLARVGNLSSSSVLHVLADTLAGDPEPGAVGVLLAFGPGVGCELVLVRWPGGS